MSLRHLIACLLFSLMLASAAFAAAPASLELDCLAKDWKQGVKGKSTIHFDRREICRISHPWEVSKNGEYGEISRTITIPKNWKPPFWLRWYVSDNYCGEGIEPSMVSEGFSAVVMIGHRFKQVLVNDSVVWERDVSDPIFPGSKHHDLREPAGGNDPFPSYFTVDISKYAKPGKTITIKLRVFEKAASTERLPKDFRAEFRWYDKPVEMQNTTFASEVYWADVSLHQGPQPAVTQVTPSWQPVLKPVPGVLGDGAGTVAQRSVQMTLEQAELLKDQPFPVRCGVPFPKGVIQADPQTGVFPLQLQDPDQKVVPVQGQVFQKWPDGSVKWARVDFLATRPQNVTGKWTLTFGDKASPSLPANSVQVKESTDEITVDTGAMTLNVKRVGENLIDTVTLAGQKEPLSSNIGNSLFVGLPFVKEDKTIVDWWVNVTAHKEAVEVEEAGPLCARLKISGHINNGKEALLGRFVTRVEAFAGQPYVKVVHRIFNDFPAGSVRVRHFELQVPIAVQKPEKEELEAAQGMGIYNRQRPPAGVFARFGDEAAKELTEVEQVALLQHAVDEYTLYDMPPLAADQKQEQAKGWAAYWGYRGGVAAYIRHFWQQYPMGFAVDNQTSKSLFLRLFAYCGEQQYYQPSQGEAKRVEMWLNFFPGEPDVPALQNFNVLAQRPPRLFSAEWVRVSGGLGPAPTNPKENFPVVYEGNTTSGYVTGGWTTEQVMHGPGVGYGLRNWGDSFEANHWVKAGYGSAWFNNYYDPIFKIAFAYLLDGKQSSFDRAQTYGAHYMDVDVCHFRAGHPEYVGGDYVLAYDHTGTLGATGERPFNQGLTLVGLLAADPDMLETVTLMGDRIIAEANRPDARIDFRGGCSRCAGYPLKTLMGAYKVNPKPEYLTAAKEMLRRSRESIDTRRGVQYGGGGPTYFQMNHGEGHIAWSAMALYRATGDEEYARLVLGLANAMSLEPGAQTGGWEPAGHMETEAAMYTYAYQLTGDESYLPHAETAIIGLMKGTWQPQEHLEAMYWLEKAGKKK